MCDGFLGGAIRANVAAYETRDRTLTMVFFAACDSFGQASGGVVAGTVLAAGGFLAVGELALATEIVPLLMASYRSRMRGWGRAAGG